MEYRILGPIDVVDRGQSVVLGTRQQRALLAILVLHANRVVATDRILEHLWPDDPTGKERTLWVYISRLRAILEPTRVAHGDSSVLVTKDHGYCLVADEDHIDARRFEGLVDQGRVALRRDPATASDVLRSGLELWRGAALEDFRYDEFARLHADRLEDLRLGALEDRIDADICCGRHRDVIGELDELVAQHPLRERFVTCQMVALYRSGRQAEALRRFERHRRFLGEEMGIEPSPELRRVEERILLHDPTLTPPPANDDRSSLRPNPFLGLHAFSERDADRFFGRERLVADVVRRIAAGRRLLALVGASGSGKSSAVQAGLIPAVRSGAVEPANGWVVARMVPGVHPFEEAEAALLRSTPDAPGSLRALMSDPDDGLLRSCLRILPSADARLLLVIDQFEELFTLGASEEVVARFIRNLEVLAGDPSGRVTTVLALRADFYGHPLRYSSFAELLEDGIVNVVPLTPDELESAAEGPAAWAQARLEPALVVQLLQDVIGQSGGLPLFQYALTELFDRRTGEMLTLDSYEALGGVSGAIARRAEDLFLSLDNAERDAAKQLFLRLVTIVDQGWGRRRVTGAEVARVAADLVAVQAVVESFASHRLLTLDLDPISGGPTVEVAHEALMREWPRLRRWIEDGRRDVVTRSRLVTAMAEWEASGRNVGYLLTGPRLDDYGRWASTSSLHLARDELAFIDASLRHRDEEAVVEEQRVARELQLNRTARRRLWGLAAVAIVVLGGVVAVAVLVVEPGQPAIAVVHGVPGDLGIADLMIAGTGDAERDHGITVDLVQPLVSAEDDLERLAEAGTELVVVGREFDLALESVAPHRPDVQWAAIDPAAVHIEAPNIAEVHFAVEQSAFVAGAAAALTSTSGRVGFIGGYQTFRTERSRNGFEQGVAWIDPDIVVVSTFLGPVLNPVVGAELAGDAANDLARSMYASGVDVIFHDAGVAGAGVVGAANVWADAHDHVWTIGSDADEYLTLPPEDRDVVLTSTIKRFDTATDSVIRSFLAGELPAGESVVGFADDAVEVSRSGGFLADIDGALKNLEGELEFGHIAVSPHARHSPDWQTEPDVVVSLTLSDGGCAVDSIEGVGDWSAAERELVVPRGSVIRFDLANATSDIAGLAVWSVRVGSEAEDFDAQAGGLRGTSDDYEAILGITTAQLGGSTGTSALADASPFVAVCVEGIPDFSSPSHTPMIVRPT